MEKYLVTGAAGFIGSHICDALVAAGHTVVGLDNLSFGSLDNLKRLMEAPAAGAFFFIKGDITDIGCCQDACAGVDYVIHQAAFGSVPRSIKEPALYEINNASGTLNIFIAAHAQKVKRVVYASSSSIYGDTQVLPKVETMTPNPLSPYAVSKFSNELYGSVFTKSYGLETIGLRYFNIFGPRQSPHSQYAAVIPKFIESLRNRDIIMVHGDGLQTRDFTFVDNAVSANLAAVRANSAACGQTYNIGCGHKTSLMGLLQIMATHMQVSPNVTHTEKREGDIRDSLADIEKAKSLLGYRPSVDLASGLERTISWFNGLND